MDADTERNPILAIVKEDSAKFPDDIDKAVETTIRRIRKLSDYADYVDGLVYGQIRHMHHDVRHTANVATRKAAGEYGGPAKVTLSEGAANAAAAASLLKTYLINGRTLGDITGKELPAIRDAERNRGAGCYFNAALCEALGPLVADDKRVDECLTDQKALAIFKRVQKSNAGAAASDGAKPKRHLPQHQTNGQAKQVEKPNVLLPDRNGQTNYAQKPNGGVSGRKTKSGAKALAGD